MYHIYISIGLVHGKHHQKIDKGQRRLVKGQKRPLLKLDNKSDLISEN